MPIPAGVTSPLGGSTGFAPKMPLSTSALECLLIRGQVENQSMQNCLDMGDVSWSEDPHNKFYCTYSVMLECFKFCCPCYSNNHH